MKISDILREDKTTISFEVFPPKTTANFESVKKAALGVAALHPDYMSVTYGAGGSSRGNTLHIAEEIQKAENVTTIAHLTCVGAGKEDIRTALSEMKEAGIENILALRGDRPKDFDGDPFKEYHYASELVATIKEYGDFCVGGACYPEGHPDSVNKKEDIKNLKKKVDAGCEFLTTQMFFDNEVFYRFERQCREAGINVPIIPGLKPLSTAKQVDLLPQSFSLDIPKVLTERIAHAGDDKDAVYEIGLDWCKEQCKDLLKHGVPAVHFYTMGKTKNITAIMKECF